MELQAKVTENLCLIKALKFYALKQKPCNMSATGLFLKP